jgi:hypothetical protein
VNDNDGRRRNIHVVGTVVGHKLQQTDVSSITRLSQIKRFEVMVPILEVGEVARALVLLFWMTPRWNRSVQSTFGSNSSVEPSRESHSRVERLSCRIARVEHSAIGFLPWPW